MSGARFLGLDIGSTTTKAALIDAEGALVTTRLIATGPNVTQAVAQICEAFDMDAVARTVATGYGRKRVSFASRRTTEITCHALGVFHQIPDTHTVIDLGGQDSKVIRVGPEGKVLDFVMNDRCAAGTGSFLELTARALQLDLMELSEAAVGAEEAVAVSSMCTVFAQTEVVHLVSEGVDMGRIARGVFASVVERILPLIRRAGGQAPYTLSGGVATLPAFARLVGEALDGPVHVPPHPQLAGAIGAALIARGS
jgi:(R)-2-hydroxyacyl-CoA dehydratese activating ATPase